MDRSCVGLSPPLLSLKSNAVAIARPKLRIRKSSVTSRVTRSGRGKTASKPYSHPNEMMDDYEVIGHIPKLMAL